MSKRWQDLSPMVWGMVAFYWLLVAIFIILIAWRVMKYEPEQNIDGLWRGEHLPGDLERGLSE